MSIQSRLKPFKLVEVVQIGKNKANQPLYDDVFIQDILVDINFISIANRSDIEIYKKCDYQGLTAYKDLKLNQSYKLIGLDSAYKIISINPMGRYNQLLLEKVVMK